MERLKAIEVALRILASSRQQAVLSPGAYAFLVRVTDRLNDEHRQLFDEQFKPPSIILSWFFIRDGHCRVNGEDFTADLTRTAAGWLVEWCSSDIVSYDELRKEARKLIGGIY